MARNLQFAYISKKTARKTRDPIHRELGHSSATYKKKIEEFVYLKDERDRGSPYEKIELFWPHPLFQVTFSQLTAIILIVYFFSCLSLNFLPET